eukprot:m.257332 g.257332  ORF g.257332 m.257332 type:complete len:269 (+) comp35183_c0_seq1:88-894(+)
MDGTSFIFVQLGVSAFLPLVTLIAFAGYPAALFALVVYGGGYWIGIEALLHPKNKTLVHTITAFIPPLYWLLEGIAKLTFHFTYTQHRNGLLRQYIPANSVGCEIGVWKGEFTEVLVDICKPSTLHLIDPWRHFGEYKDAWFGGQCEDGQKSMDAIFESVRAKFPKEEASGKVVFHRGMSEEVDSEIPDGSLDWVYVDGNHMYEFVKKDLELYYPKVRKGGIIFGDDYMLGVGWWGDGVVEAVDEFVENNKANLEVLNMSCQFVLRKK